jgi:hypothetical protein
MRVAALATMGLPAASREEIAALLGDVDSSFIERIRDTGASIDQIGEARDDLEGRLGEQRHVPSSLAVAEVRAILEELFSGDGGIVTVQIAGEPLGPGLRS